MDFLNKFTDYILNSEKRFSAKFMLLASVVGGLLFADYFFRFSDSYITNTKIKQIEQIENILLKDSLGIDAKNELVRMEKTVIMRRGFWDLIPSFASLTFLIQKTINSPNANVSTNKPNKPTVRERDVWYHNLSSGWIFWLLIAVSPFALFSEPQGAKTVVGILLLDFFAAICAFILSYLFAFIPVLWFPLLNYILNSILCFGLIWGLTKLGTKANRKS